MANERLSALIAELSFNKSDGDRKKTKARLEERFKFCDGYLNQLIKENCGDLSKIVELSSEAIRTIAVSKNKCRDLKQRLMFCKSLLQCKSDELRRMWMESLQHKYAHEMLREIESMLRRPEEIANDMMDKKFIHATEVLVSSIRFLDESLCSTGALKDLKLELFKLQEKFYCVFLEELRKELYISDSFFRKFNEGSFRDVTYEEMFNSRLSEKKRPAFKESLNQMNFDNLHVVVLLDCISMLNRLPETVEFLKGDSQQELMKVVKKSAKLMYDILRRYLDQPVFELPASQQQQFLVDLLESVLDTFRQVISNHRNFANILSGIAEKKGFVDLRYQLEDIYSKIQTTIEHFVGEYLEVEPNTLSCQESSFFSQNVNDLSSFFLRPESKPNPLFKFRSSALGMHMKKYPQEQRECKAISNESSEEEEFKKSYLVCKPSVRNIIFIFNPLKNFVSETEHYLLAGNDVHCPLRAFLFDSANVFLDQVNSEVNRMLGSAYANLEAWNVSVIHDHLSSRRYAEKHILTSILILNSHLKELQRLIDFLPDYSSHFLHLIYYIILDYKDLFQKAFKNLFEEEQNILSISWARDSDIRRLLKSFSNWKYLQNTECNDIVESPEDIRLRNKEESELLIRNLNSEEQSSWDIIKDYNKLLDLALLHESLQWFCGELSNLIPIFNQILSQSVSDEGVFFKEMNTELSSSDLNKLFKEYSDFSDMCLLALHLEVRAQCFHFLLSFSGQGFCFTGSSQDLDIAVKHLTTSLLRIDEILHPVLCSKKLKYVFEGLGELVSSLFILHISNLNKISENLVPKIDHNIFIIQCCLASITMTREVSLERVRQYTNLLKLSADEIFNIIVEEGLLFQQYEYASVFRLLSQDLPLESKAEMLEEYLQKLRNIFEKVSSE